MSDPQRREFLAGAAMMAAAGSASLVGVRGARRRYELYEQRARPAVGRQGIAHVQVRPGKIGGQGAGRKLWQGGHGRAVADLQGHCRSFHAARAGRHARAALARHGGRVGLRHRGSGAHDRHRPAGLRRDQRFRTWRRLVFSAGPRTHARMPGQRAVSFHPDLRQRLFLRIRHIQHQRLDRPHAQAAVGQEFRAPRVGLRWLSHQRGLLCPRQAAAGRGGPAAGRMEAAAANAQVSPAGRAAPRILQGGPRVARRLDAISKSRRPSRASSWNSIPARCASCTGIPAPTSGSTSSRGRSA